MTEAEKEAREALIERFDTMRNSGICSPTTRSLLDDAQAFLEASRAPQPTEDERRIPGFAERERGAQAAWEFFARDDRDVSRDFRAGYHQGTIDEARRRAPQPTDDDQLEPVVVVQAALDAESLRQIAEWVSGEVGHKQTAARLTLIANRHERLAAGFRRAPAEPAVQGEWEYGYRLVGDDGNVYKRGFAYDDPRDASERGRARVIEENEVHEANGMHRLSFELIRRRKAGPWESVTPKEEQ